MHYIQAAKYSLWILLDSIAPVLTCHEGKLPLCKNKTYLVFHLVPSVFSAHHRHQGCRIPPLETSPGEGACSSYLQFAILIDKDTVLSWCMLFMWLTLTHTKFCHFLPPPKKLLQTLMPSIFATPAIRVIFLYHVSTCQYETYICTMQEVNKVFLIPSTCLALRYLCHSEDSFHQ